MARRSKRGPRPAGKAAQEGGFRGRPRQPRERQESDRLFLYGLHAVEAALANKNRKILRLLATENAAHRLEAALQRRGLKAEITDPKQLDRLVGADAVHQGAILEVAQLPPLGIEDVRPEGLLIVLDQVTDPHNVGAVLRSAAAFGASGLLMPARHSPPLTGTLAKVASGALDVVPVILVGNLAQALTALGEIGFLRVGLAEQGAEALETASLTLPLALVLGAEGTGLRQLTRERCDMLCRIATRGAFASLNVSNAAAIALHWASTTAKVT